MIWCHPDVYFFDVKVSGILDNRLSKVLSKLLCRLLSDSDDSGYIKWVDLSIVIVVMLTLALTAHAYLVRKILGRAVASNRQTKLLDSAIIKKPKCQGRELAMDIGCFFLATALVGSKNTNCCKKNFFK